MELFQKTGFPSTTGAWNFNKTKHQRWKCSVNSRGQTILHTWKAFCVFGKHNYVPTFTTRAD